MAPSIPDRELEFSPMSGRVTGQGITVTVHIYRFADALDHLWQLEVVDHEGGSTVWDETFSTEDDAYRAFARAVEEYGMASFAEADGETRH